MYNDKESMARQEISAETQIIKVNNRTRYKCDVCERLCESPGHLMLHKRFHTGEKPFGCET